MTPNTKNVKLTLKRIDLCDLMIACTIVAEESGVKKWSDLHDKLEAILDDFDKKEGIGVFEQ